ncbi:hypothetical protein ACFCX4_07085 [Kitasatospora sp. NPDC056327]|uniref:hypothetical protein n=1 Tax=Kitasatospora sp. NPDC056327 TaxID=3345785 RepID=UPI0035D7EEC3
MHRRTAAALTGTALLAALTATAAPSATAAPAGPPGPVVTCGTPGAPGFLLTRACIEVNGTQARIYGQVTPTSPSWVAQNVGFRLAGASTALPPQPPVYPTVLVPTGGTTVNGLTLTVPCGSTVTADFSVNNGGWPPSTATVTASVPC